MLRPLLHKPLLGCLALACLQVLPAIGQDADLDALTLESAPEASAPPSTRDTKVFIEGALGSATQRYQNSARSLGRVSVDLTHAAKLAPGLRGVISDRLDQFEPRLAGADATVNNLREAYLTWQPEGGGVVLEAGRVNLRYGTGYGYNPTDFFRDGGLRTQTTADPFALRENRLGTVLLRAQRLWANGSLSVAYSPKLADQASADGWDIDLGATNNRNRALVALGSQFSQRLGGQALLYKEDGMSPALGFNLTALLSDAAVAHLEMTRSTESGMLRRALAVPGAASTRNRLAGGVTYTTASKLSVTAEYQYNGFAVSPSDWAALGAAGPSNAQFAYLQHAQARQELVPRQAYLIYVTQKSLVLKNLDLTAFVRLNADDHSRLVWLELRHHWPQFDLAFQIQQAIGDSTTEYGLWPDSTLVQVLGSYYF